MTTAVAPDPVDVLDGVDVPAILAGWDARICAACGGGRVAIRVPARTMGQVDRREFPAPRVVPCRACCCPCGAVTGGGLCTPCEDAAFLDADDAYRRGADRCES